MVREEDNSFLRDWETDSSPKAVEDHVIRSSPGVAQENKFDHLKKRICEEENTLFLIMHDEGID